MEKINPGSWQFFSAKQSHCHARKVVTIRYVIRRVVSVPRSPDLSFAKKAKYTIQGIGRGGSKERHEKKSQPLWLRLCVVVVVRLSVIARPIRIGFTSCQLDSGGNQAGTRARNGYALCAELKLRVELCLSVESLSNKG